MAELKNLELAKATFATLCKYLDEQEWHYNKNEEKLSIECGARGEDLPMDFTIKVDVDRMLVLLLSHLPFKIGEDKRLEAAVAVCAINNVAVDGNFDYDISTGNIFFRITNSFLESQLDEDVFQYMLQLSCQFVDKYNDRFLMLSKGMLTLEKFLETLTD